MHAKVQVKCLTLEKSSPVFIVCLVYNYFCLYYAVTKGFNQDHSLFVLDPRRAYN